MSNRNKRFTKQIRRYQTERIVYLERKISAMSVQKADEDVCPVIPSSRKSVIFKSELDYISRCILDYPDIETGGQLFGYWSEDGVPVVLFAIGPGPKANHQRAFFNQDVDYLLRIGNELNRRFGLEHIGEWHSHHRLGLARPSGHDANTMISTIREKNLGRFLLCIGNCDSVSSSLNPFMCDAHECRATSWDVIMADSPARGLVTRELNGMLEDPRTRTACHKDSRLNGAGQSRPEYASSYWLEKRENGVVLNAMLEYVRRSHRQDAVISVKLDGEGHVHIVISDATRAGEVWKEDIVFPGSFPQTAPSYSITYRNRTRQVYAGWGFVGDILSSFKSYYQAIRNNI